MPIRVTQCLECRRDTAEVCPVPDERPEVTYKANIDPKETAATEAWVKEAATLPGWKELLNSPDVETRHCANFLLVTMPASDRHKVTGEMIAENIRLALAARHRFPWAQQVPWPIFLNDVLPYACLDEARDPWRADFLKRFGDMVKDAPSRDAAAKLICKHTCCESKGNSAADKKVQENQSIFSQTFQSGAFGAILDLH